MMPIYCDESGGVGRGVMTLAALSIDADAATDLLSRWRRQSGLRGELKGSRINLGERAAVFDLLSSGDWQATVSIAISALKPGQGADRGDHDIAIYAALLEDAVGEMLGGDGDCTSVIIDDGRYGPATLALVRDRVGRLVGPCGMAKLDLSHRSAGLQFADVIANSFFNRALVNERQARMAAIVAPFLENGKIKLRVLNALADQTESNEQQDK